MKRTRRILFQAVFALLFVTLPAHAVDVTLTIDENVRRPSALEAAQHNLAAVLSEINRAQQAKEPVSVKNLRMDEFAKKSLARLWAVTPFYCDDEEIVERCWVFKNGTMMVSHIPLIITPEEENFGLGTYQEAVVEFDTKGQLIDFRFALDAQTAESMERCGTVVDKEKQMIILQYVERFRTAYNQKDLPTIEKMFSDDALIITGKVIKQKKDHIALPDKIIYKKRTKQEYLTNLRRVFAANSYIRVTFDEIKVMRHPVNPNFYGVTLHQGYTSNNYHDEGYLFLLWDFTDEDMPQIHVRTWQPDQINGGRIPEDEIFSLSDFDI